ncbi:extensin-like domain-containing protein [Rhizobium oryzicola]|uniref:Extensin family protein n=1 Tax=Rhizobium oryzicola TaxID=1232668 RepID=A0ABT8T1M8_9HYPH|nr:extensin family protein [Rhizobium oryzicola]MDO1584664.1 extensin family protein [Rhizobium oryzicola]
MAYAFSSRRVVAFLMISTVLVGCTADGLVPPAPIDKGTRVGAIRPPQPLPQGYGGANQPVAQASGNLGYLDNPNLAAPHAPQPEPMTYPATSQPQSMRGGRLPAIDSAEALANDRGPRNLGTLTIPAGGVNMDDGLGVGAPNANAMAAQSPRASSQRVVGLAEEQNADIAEGATSQPVVTGIGTDNPVAVGGARRTSAPAPRQAAPQPLAEDDLVIVPPKRQSLPPRGDAVGQQTPRWGDQSMVVPPSRQPAQMQEVAMLMPNKPTVNETPRAPAQMPASEVACRAELRRMGVQYRDLATINDGPSCGIPYPVELSGLAGGIDVKPATKLNCQTTLAFAKWVKNELQPAARTRYWSGVKTIQSMGGYSCRRMNNSNQRYNPMSEHAHGNAIDVGAFVLNNGHDIDVRKKGLFSFREGGLLKSVRSDSCKYFNTVLGPGSNAEHWNHFHFDLRSRASGNRYCD